MGTACEGKVGHGFVAQCFPQRGGRRGAVMAVDFENSQTKKKNLEASVRW